MLRVLRAGKVVPDSAAATPTVVDELLADYGAYLLGERGLAAESVRCYCVQGRKFLTSLPAPLDEALTRLDAAQVTSFVVSHSTAAASVWSAKAAVTALRSLLRYLHVAGLIPVSLTAAVPAVAGWRLDSLPAGCPEHRSRRCWAGATPPRRPGCGTGRS